MFEFWIIRLNLLQCCLDKFCFFVYVALPWVPDVFPTAGIFGVGRRPTHLRQQATGHYKDLTETGNRARKVSGTQGNVAFTSFVGMWVFARAPNDGLPLNTLKSLLRLFRVLLDLLEMHPKRHSKVCICSVITGELESFRNYKGFSYIFPKILDAISLILKVRIFLITLLSQF